MQGFISLFQAHLYPQSITELVFDVSPSVRASEVNFLERLWAYLTIKNLLELVAKGEFNSCREQEKEGEDIGSTRVRHKREDSGRFLHSRSKDGYVAEDGDDEDYSEGSGEDEEEEEGEDYLNGVEDVMDMIGDADIIICNNLERALYLSLKYEFVTPLTSLVVVKPDTKDSEGDFREAGLRDNIRLISGSTAQLGRGPSWMVGILAAVAAALATTTTSGLKLTI